MDNQSELRFTLDGDAAKIEEIVAILKSGKPINNWDAKIDSVTEEFPADPPKHQVTTENVDQFKWRNCEMYL